MRIAAVASLLTGGFLAAQHAHAAGESNFALQVSPSPLVTTMKPGETKTLELKIRNASTAEEKLKIEARSIKFDSASGDVSLDDSVAPTVAKWITLPAPGFTVRAGEWQTKKVTLSLPSDAGFSYSFSLVVSRNEAPSTTSSGRLFKGSIAVFTLINVDRPGAKRELEIASIATDKKVYEYLPATLTVRLKNTGNTITQPYGNIFIQRSSTNTDPIATLPVNDSQAYILPGTERPLTAEWSSGFPSYKKVTNASGTQTTVLDWNLDHLREFRIGKYTAKVVVVYNDGTRDIPVIGEVSFWVIPWKAILILLAGIIGAIVLLRYYIKFRTTRAVKKALAEQGKQ